MIGGIPGQPFASRPARLTARSALATHALVPIIRKLIGDPMAKLGVRSIAKQPDPNRLGARLRSLLVPGQPALGGMIIEQLRPSLIKLYQMAGSISSISKLSMRCSSQRD